MSKGNWKKKEKNWVEQTNNAATKWRNVREVNERRYKSDEDVKFFKQDQVSDMGCFAACFWHLVPGSSCYFAKVKPRNIHVYIGVVAVALEFWTTVPIISHASHLCRFPPILFVQDVGQVWIEHRLNSAGEPTISLQRRESPRMGRTSAQQVPVPGNPYAWNITTCHHAMSSHYSTEIQGSNSISPCFSRTFQVDPGGSHQDVIRSTGPHLPKRAHHMTQGFDITICHLAWSMVCTSWRLMRKKPCCKWKSSHHRI